MLNDFFNPRTIAVIGASCNAKKVGYAVLNNLINSAYRGGIYPVNRQASEILGLKAYPSLSSIGQQVDLVVICVPAASLPEVIRDCGSAKIKAAVVISAGFRETGHGGLLLEQELSKLASEYGIRILGPNCLGVINTANNMNAAFGGEAIKGRTAFFSQSGALGVAIMDWALDHKFGFSKVVSLGNKSDLNETDFLEYFVNDPETDVILGYVEDVVDGRRFMEVARKSAQMKPIIFLKSGGTLSGARAASSHTGALAGSDTAFAAAFKQTGIIRAEGIQDLFDLALIFASGKLPAGDRLLIITNAGGPGILAADAADKLGVALVPMTRTSINAVAARLPSIASLYNPIDIICDATSERYAAVLDAAITDENVDGILVLLTPQAMTDIDNTAEIIINMAAKTDKPIITAFIGGKKVRPAIERMRASGVPSFAYPEVAVAAYRTLCEYTIARRKKKRDNESYIASHESRKAVQMEIDSLLATGISEFEIESAMPILTNYGFSFPEYGLARTSRDAAAISQRLGYPVVMKIASPDIRCKTDVGGVQLKIESADSAAEAFTEITANVKRFMPEAYIAGVNVCRMIEEGDELILSVNHDKTFGHIIVLRQSGSLTEQSNAVACRIAPVSRGEAQDMVAELSSHAPFLSSASAAYSADLNPLVDAIMKISTLVEDFPIIREIEVNPIKVMQKGVFALDSRIVLEPRA
ncbi:MAG TPA: acetate--CoA ligase family protein [Dissulfurispiraceae bacterium]|nr:acetate--CoA ligase family protein [Dissulfurispiraceae bacterium]